MYPNKSVCRNLNDVLCTVHNQNIARFVESCNTGVALIRPELVLLVKFVKSRSKSRKPEHEPEAGFAYTGDGFTALLFVSYLAVGVDLVQMLDRYA